MPIPQSFVTDGFYNPSKPRQRRRLLIGSEGWTDTGKTEFIYSCPGPGINLAVDPAYEGVMDNQSPPKSRRPDWVTFDIKIPMNEMSKDALPHLGGTKYETSKDMYKAYWRHFRTTLYKALDNPDAISVGIDGDSDTWELQKLSEFGRTNQILPITTGSIKSRRRLLIYRAFHSGKNVIATNKLKIKYEKVQLPDGSYKIDDRGEFVREATDDVERQGYPEQDYLWQFQIRHLYKKAESIMITRGPNKGQVVPGRAQWGIRIMKSKVNTEMVGHELWGDKANFQGLIELFYPQTDQSEWGL